MTLTGIAPIKQALVQTLRDDSVLKAALTGGIHEALAPQRTVYPFLVYSLHYAPLDYIWGSVIQTVGIDVFVFARNSVEASNLDGLVLTTLHDAQLSVSGQSTLICRRVASVSFPDVDEEGNRIFQAGGTYEIWTDQPL
jgi:hypothetical protein